MLIAKGMFRRVMKSANTLPVSGTLSRRRCLTAVASRDARMDSAFVYGVRSTGIYCRPSCPSRRPRPKQIQFFAIPEAAERAGFRACLRCRPQNAPRSMQSELISRVCREIDAGTDTDRPADLRRLAATAGLSAQHLQRSFRHAMGITPRQYADAIRVERLKSNLRKGTDVTTALYETGYGSPSRLYEKSDEQLGMTPATYRRGGHGMRISYTIADCALGRVLVAATDRGISAVYLGDKDEPLAAALRNEYPQADISRNSNEHSQWVRAIVRHLAGSQPQLDLPTDVAATAFQRRVWEALRAIPFGATRTYSQLANSLGRPTATRAVARACATNPASIVVPCHRVIRTDGSLGGYRWGLDRKKLLLEQELRMAKGASSTQIPRESHAGSKRAKAVAATR
ncbi:MAG: ada, AraC family transcriptional regulator, regulatory protein of adaptative response [Candidatus Acidoferrum typicum]|nr:ada, AraC family transcriptional regulator, regulatory protein of adaptative response [Candidatus Acidoferrum typicum]